ncbi:MAG: NADP-dependent isocitrate dehydrogenase [Pseudomonadota bacterium]
MSDLITMDASGNLQVPDRPIIVYIQGDGIGPDIWRAARPVLDAAVDKAYKGKKAIQWMELLAGEAAFEATGEWLSDATLDAIRKHRVAIKGPLATPVGKGIRSLNVRIRQSLDLYACIRPVKYFSPVLSPVREPEKVDITVFRENTEDLYSGIEFDSNSPESERFIRFMKDKMKVDLCPSAAIGIKPMCPEKTKRLVVKALDYAVKNNLKSVTLMHKGNIMKFTEGGFRKWGYEAATEFFRDVVITEKELWENHGGAIPQGKVLIRDRIADMVFAEVLLKPQEFDVIAAPNLNGDYISDALAAQVGGLGIAPGANIGDSCAVFEATHGTAPDLAGKDMANPCSIILSGAMMFDHMGWHDAAVLVRTGLQKALQSGKATQDLAREMTGVREVSCSGFGEIIVEKIGLTLN